MKNIIIGTAFLILFSACYNNGEKLQKKNNKNQLQLSIGSEIPTLDPALAYDNVSSAVMGPVLEQLYEYHYLNRPYELMPQLAENLPTISNNEKTYTIKIKKGIYYHPHPAFLGHSRELIAEDFVNAFKRLVYSPLHSTGEWTISDTIVGANEFKKIVGNDFEKFFTTKIKGVYSQNRYTLIIETKNIAPQFIYKLTMPFFSPVPSELIRYLKNDLSKILIGTGPFIYSPTTTTPLNLNLTKNPSYRESKYPESGDRFANGKGYLKDAGETIPFVDEITFKVIKKSSERVQSFLAQGLDLTILSTESFLDVFDSFGNLKEKIRQTDTRVQNASTLTMWWLSFNMRDPILGKNLNLRKAIAHAIDFNKYNLEFTNGTAQIANSLIPPGIFGYSPASKLPYEYNLKMAFQYLEKAGYPKGRGLPTIFFDTHSENDISIKQAKFLQNELKKIGINVKININHFQEYLAKARAGQLQFFQDAWTLDYPDAENIFQLLIKSNFAPGPNSTFFTNPKLEKKYIEMTQTTTPAKKQKLIKEMEEIVNIELPWIVQYYARNVILLHDRVKNFRYSDLIWNYPKYIRLY